MPRDTPPALTYLPISVTITTMGTEETPQNSETAAAEDNVTASTAANATDKADGSDAAAPTPEAPTPEAPTPEAPTPDSTAGKAPDNTAPPASSDDRYESLFAITDPKSGEPQSIEDVIVKLSANRELAENQRIAYIGAGRFALIRREPGKPAGGRSGKEKQVIEEIIEYEEGNERAQWRMDLKRHSGAPYTPNPEPLNKLYSAQQIKEMPKFNGQR